MNDIESDALERSLMLNAWIYTSTSANGTKRERKGGEETLRLLDGSCGYRSLLTRDVFERLNVPVRRVNFFSIPVQGGHSSPELYIDGAWRFIDPTFGLFFSTPEAPYTPISIDKARSLYPNVQIMKAQLPGWQGKWMPLAEIASSWRSRVLYRAIPSGWVEHPQSPGKLVADILQTYFASTMTRSEATDQFRHPVYIDLGRSPEGAVGIHDGSYKDLMTPFHEVSYGRLYHPFLYFIGSYKIGKGPNVLHNFSFVSDIPRNIRLTIIFVKPIHIEDKRYFISQIDHVNVEFSASKHMIDSHWERKKYIIRTPIVPPVTTIELFLPKRFALQHRFFIDAIQWSTL